MLVVDNLLELKEWILGSDEFYLVHQLPISDLIDFHREKFIHFTDEAISIIFCVIQMEFDRTKIIYFVDECIDELLTV
mgnify:CR=1 FL=1|tara:strand:- start:348 stop:581 length:234 start_codon:yes stop_codon:yes gene_type:complete